MFHLNRVEKKKKMNIRVIGISNSFKFWWWPKYRSTESLYNDFCRLRRLLGELSNADYYSIFRWALNVCFICGCMDCIWFPLFNLCEICLFHPSSLSFNISVRSHYFHSHFKTCIFFLHKENYIVACEYFRRINHTLYGHFSNE